MHLQQGLHNVIICSACFVAARLVRGRHACVKPKARGTKALQREREHAHT